MPYRLVLALPGASREQLREHRSSPTTCLQSQFERTGDEPRSEQPRSQTLAR
jgi:hypothetical protein